MFAGGFTHTMDDKGRFFIPSRFRDALEGMVVITHGLDGCLFAYGMEVWETVVASFDNMPGNKEEIRNFQRFFVGGAVICEIDKQGRCLLPLDLRSYAGIENELRIVGVGKKMEIWSVKKWESRMAPENINPEFIAAKIESINI